MNPDLPRNRDICVVIRTFSAGRLIRSLFSCTRRPTSFPFRAQLIRRNRAQEEDAQFGEDTLQTLASVVRESNLRYALNLTSTANTHPKGWKSEKIEVVDVKRAYEYFLDLMRSQEWLKGQMGKLIFEGQHNDDRIDLS